MHKFLSLAILLLLAACAVPTPAMPTQQPPLQTPTIAASVTLISPSSTSTASPEPTITSTETSAPLDTAEPTLSPLVDYDQIDALTLFDETSGWALWSNHTPSETWQGYDVDQRIIRTVEGLERWQDVTPMLEGSTLRVADFVDANTAVALFHRSFMPESAETEITAARTTDGGQTWQMGETTRFDCCLRSPAQVEMLDAKQGWMMAVDDGSMGQIPLSFYRTTDGGLHWEKVYDSEGQFQIHSGSTMFGSRNPIGYHGFVLLDFDTALYASGWLYRTEDGGKSWQQVSLPIPPTDTDDETEAGIGEYPPPVTVPQFWSEKEGVMVGRYYKDLMIPPGTPTSLPVAEFLYFTNNGGQTWSYKPSPAKIGIPFFLDSRIGWYLGKSDADPSMPTQICQTTDNGDTCQYDAPVARWSPIPLGSEMRFFNALTGYAVVTSYGYDYLFDARAGKGLPYFFMTHDGGRFWKQISPQILP